MSIQNFIPTIWSARLLANLNKSLVYGNIVNRDYEGEISGQGSTVKINSIGDVTVGTYDKTAGIGSPEELSSAQTTLTITEAKYFNFKVDDVDKAQSNVNVLDGAMSRAAYNLADVMDQYIAGLYTGVAAGNTIGDDTTPIVPTASDAYDHVVDLGVVLDEANVPTMGRFVVVPSWFHGLLLKDTRFVRDVNIMHTGYIGTVNGMQVYKSNNVPNTTGTKYKIIAGYTGAISFANQINSVEAYRPQESFADAVKGLQLYGASLVRPSGIAVLTANKS